MSLLTRAFWSYASERAIKTAAQTVLVLLGIGFAAGTQPGSEAHVVNAFALDWLTLGGVALGGAFVSLLTSIASFELDRAGLIRESLASNNPSRNKPDIGNER